MRARVVLAAAAAVLLVGCGHGGTSAGPVASTPPAVGSPTPSPTLTGPTSYRSSIAPIPAELASQMRATTWHPGCPVPIADLRLLTLSYWGFDGTVHKGPMVVNEAVASKVVWVFRQLFAARFPIEQMALSTKYDPTANPNTKTDVTASFNCRPIVTPTGPGTSFSMHASGLAIDINPLLNPFVGADGTVLNRYTRPYTDRTKDVPGMIHPGDVVVRAFAHIGWSWGGLWAGGKDYMHFSSTGT